MGVCGSNLPPDIEDSEVYNPEDSIEQQQTTKPTETTDDAKEESIDKKPQIKETKKEEIIVEKTKPKTKPKVKPKEKPKPKPKPKYYVNIVTIYQRETKQNGEFEVVVPHEYYKCWGNNDPCKPTDDPNTLIEPFEDNTKGSHYWVEEEWKQDYTNYVKINRTTRNKVLTRVAIFEREYGTKGFIYDEFIKLVRQLLWHQKFYNNYNNNISPEDEENNNENDEKKNNDYENEFNEDKPPKHHSSLFEVFKIGHHNDNNNDDNSPLKNKRCIEYIEFYQQLHCLSKAVFNYENKKILTKRQSIKNLHFTINGKILDENKELEIDNNDEKMEDPFDKLGNLEAKDEESINIRRKDSEQVKLYHRRRHSRHNSLGPRFRITRNDIETIQLIFSNLSYYLQSALYRKYKYNKNELLNIQNYIFTLITKDLKVFYQSTLPDIVKECILLQFYVQLTYIPKKYDVVRLNITKSDVYTIKEDVNELSPYDKYKYITDLYNNNKNNNIKLCGLWGVNILNIIDSLLDKLEKDYKSNFSKKELEEKERLSSLDELKADTDDSAYSQEEDIDKISDDENENNNSSELSKEANEILKLDNNLFSSDETIEKILKARYAGGVLDITEDKCALDYGDIEAFTVNKQYKKLIRQVHPDKNNDPKAREAFEKIQKAYEALKEGVDYDFLHDNINIYEPDIESDEENDNNNRQTRLKSNDSAKYKLNNIDLIVDENDLFGVSMDDVAAEGQVLDQISHLLQGWLRDHHEYDINITVKIMLWFRRIKLLQAAIIKKKLLKDPYLDSYKNDIIVVLTQCMTKSTIRKYKSINSVVTNKYLLDNVFILSQDRHKESYNEYFNNLKNIIQISLFHINETVKLNIFKARKTKPFVKLCKVFFSDNVKLVPKLNNEIDSLLTPTDEKNPLSNVVIFILNQLSNFILFSNSIINNKYNMMELDFRNSLQEIQKYIETELNKRYLIYVDVALIDIRKLIWEYLKKYNNKTYDEIINFNIKQLKLSNNKNMNEPILNTFTFIQKIINNWFNLLVSLPQNELVAVINKHNPTFFNGMLRILLSFINDLKPLFDDIETIKQKKLNTFLKEQEKISKSRLSSVNIVPKNKKKTSINSKISSDTNNELKVDIGSDNEENDEKKEFKSNSDIEKEKKVHETLSNMGYDDDEINANIEMRGNDITLILWNLMDIEKSNYRNNSSQLNKAIFGKKGKIENTEFIYICIMIGRIDSVSLELDKLENSMITHLKNIKKSLVNNMTKLCNNLINVPKHYLNIWIQENIQILSKYILINELKMHQNFYPSNMAFENNDMKDTLIKLKRYILLFKEHLRLELCKTINLYILKQFINIILWILLDNKSNRIYYRSWIINEKTENAYQSLLSAKFRADLDLLQVYFVNEFEVNENDFNNEIKILKDIYDLMDKSTAELIYEHQKRSLRYMINSHNKESIINKKHSVTDDNIETDINGLIINNGLDDKLFSIIQHRKKSYAEEYVKSYILNHNLNDPNDKTKSPKSHTSILNRFKHIKDWPIKHDNNSIINDLPLFIEIIGGYKLRNKRKFGGTSNPYCIISVLDEIYNSKVLSSNLEPRWKDEGFVFLIPNDYFTKKDKLEILVEFKDGKHFMGLYKFNISRSNQINDVKTETFYGKNFEQNDKKSYGQFKIRINSQFLFKEQNLNDNYKYNKTKTIRM